MLEGIKEKITRLVALYETEKKRGDDLSASLAKREEELDSCKKQITELKRQIANQELGSAFTATGDNKAAKDRINRLISEIDRCIKLLED